MSRVVAYRFDHPHQLERDDLVDLLGGKGAGLAEMTRMGLPVPPGFTLPTAMCRDVMAQGWQQVHVEAVLDGIRGLESATGKQLGDNDDPLLVSVRSGAGASMPGMMDTVLNAGMTPLVSAALAARSGDLRFADDTTRRADESFRAIVGVPPPVDPVAQVVEAVRAVFDSWNSPRAQAYRDREGIPHDLGTAATVQAMVFGNLGDDSGTGVAFTRDPSTGAPGLIGDFLAGAQGEDVVAGTHTTEPLAAMSQRWPELWDELVAVADRLERHYADMVDIEFTVEAGRLYLLQARRGKRSPLATFRTAVDMAEDPAFPLDRAGAVVRCRRLFASPPRLVAEDADDATPTVVATGLRASLGRAVGALCRDVDEAVEWEADGRAVVLVRAETSPRDVHGMAASVGLVTTLGGLVSHAAVVAHEWGLPAVVGATDITLADDHVVGRCGRVDVGTIVTVDGDGGRLLLGDHGGSGALPDVVETVLEWADELDARPAPAAPVARADDVDHARIVVDGIDFAVAHALRIRGMAPSETVAAIAGLGVDETRTTLDALVAAGEAKYLEARDAWALVPAGRDAHDRRLAAATHDLDLDALPYDDFLELNGSFKALCAAWQVRDGTPNDHADDAYDRSIVERLVVHHEAAEPIVAAIAAVVPWTRPYGPRLSAALGRVTAGDHTAITGVLSDSYHDIWMELHEDLILTQGIDRAAEGST